jgi:general secretion pathway protein A
VPGKQAMPFQSAGRSGGDTVMVATAADLDVDLSKLKLEIGEAEAMNKQIAALTADQRGDQLQRLERSMLRLERINVQTLSMLQKLVKAVSNGSGEGGK